MSYLQTHCPETYAQGAMARYDAEYFAPKVERPDINESMPRDYIKSILVRTNDVANNSKFISAKFAEVYGAGVKIDFIEYDLTNGFATVMLNRKADEFNPEQLNAMVEEIETNIGSWL